MLPYLTEEVNPRAAAHMAQTSLDLLETEEYLEQQTDQLMERYASAEKNAVVLRDAVSSEAPLLQRYVIRRVLEQLAGKRKDLTREHLESVRELFEKQVGKSVCLPYGITAVRGYETLRLEKQGVRLVDFHNTHSRNLNQDDHKASLLFHRLNHLQFQDEAAPASFFS